MERPIRIDDWVVVGKEEGFVKKINIRATQIETWQKATVVIPNADLLSSNLVNWYLNDTIGRVEIQIRIAYGCDTARVRDILLQAANEHPKVLMDPEPHVLVMHFGDAGLELELRFFTGEIAWRLFIASDIRYQIDRNSAKRVSRSPIRSMSCAWSRANTLIWLEERSLVRRQPPTPPA